MTTSTRFDGPQPTQLEVGPFYVDVGHFQVFLQGQPLQLTRLQFDLLYYMISNSHRVVSAEELTVEVIRTMHVPGHSALRVHVHHLRRKLGNAAVAVQTVRGRGFWFDETRLRRRG
jgi:DNA-binding response OmpR family regulator